VGNYTFYIVDVFTEEKYSGNQLAVFRNAQYLTDIEMQQIAREMNYSETTFIETDTEQDSGYNVRIFTPQSEIPFDIPLTVPLGGSNIHDQVRL